MLITFIVGLVVTIGLFVIVIALEGPIDKLTKETVAAGGTWVLDDPLVILDITCKTLMIFTGFIAFVGFIGTILPFIQYLADLTNGTL
jgi:hypothetical protein